MSTSCDYMSGYWQSENYFESNRSILINDFSFRIPLNARNADALRLISSSNSVSIHIRRGDYLHNANAKATHGLCSLEYYHKAIRLIKATIGKPRFFIFSDDMLWVKAHLEPEEDCIFVDWNFGVDSYNDMRLMSLCKHNIIANSSFSWWGAWLNRNPDKVIIAPKRWFAGKINDSNIIPSSWIRI